MNDRQVDSYVGADISTRHRTNMNSVAGKKTMYIWGSHKDFLYMWKEFVRMRERLTSRYTRTMYIFPNNALYLFLKNVVQTNGCTYELDDGSFRYNIPFHVKVCREVYIAWRGAMLHVVRKLGLGYYPQQRTCGEITPSHALNTPASDIQVHTERHQTEAEYSGYAKHCFTIANTFGGRGNTISDPYVCVSLSGTSIHHFTQESLSIPLTIRKGLKFYRFNFKDAQRGVDAQRICDTLRIVERAILMQRNEDARASGVVGTLEANRWHTAGSLKTSKVVTIALHPCRWKQMSPTECYVECTLSKFSQPRDCDILVLVDVMFIHNNSVTYYIPMVVHRSNGEYANVSRVNLASCVLDAIHASFSM